MLDRLSEVAPDITLQYLGRLLAGHSPRDIDLEAVTHALEADREKWLSKYWHLEDEEPRRIASIVFSRHLKSHTLVSKFVGYLDSVPSFRTMDLTEGEILKHLREFQRSSAFEDEIDLFRLDNEYD